MDLHICILGAGVGWLRLRASSLVRTKLGFKHISVYETALNLDFVGASIQLASNLARILERLGCRADISKEAVELKESSIRRGIGFYFPNEMN
jgi:salicylate hydroxylase